MMPSTWRLASCLLFLACGAVQAAKLVDDERVVRTDDLSGLTLLGMDGSRVRMEADLQPVFDGARVFAPVPALNRVDMSAYTRMTGR